MPLIDVPHGHYIVPIEALHGLVDYADGARTQVDQEFTVSRAEREESADELRKLVDALMVPGLSESIR